MKLKPQTAFFAILLFLLSISLELGEGKFIKHFSKVQQNETLRWPCQLSPSGCYLKNLNSWAPFKVESNFASINQKSLVLDIGSVARTLHGLNGPKPIYRGIGIRLTSTIKLADDYREACMHFSYYMSGIGLKSVHILQNSAQTDCLYAEEFGSHNITQKQQGKWRDIQLNLNLIKGVTQFIIEFHFDAPSPGIIEKLKNQQSDFTFDYSDLGAIAIRNFALNFDTCNSISIVANNECNLIEPKLKRKNLLIETTTTDIKPTIKKEGTDTQKKVYISYGELMAKLRTKQKEIFGWSDGSWF